jgi:hypothetical protein
MKQLSKYLLLLIAVFTGINNITYAQTAKTKKILVIGVDGIINSAIEYASTPAIDKLQINASYSMNGYGGVPAFASTGWSTMLTGVSSDKHGVLLNKSFTGNKFTQYPSVVSRIKLALPATKVASIVRTLEINNFLNAAADLKFQYATDAEVYTKSEEMLNQADIGAVFVQFSNPSEIGQNGGYQLRKASYVLAVQKIDEYVQKLHAAIEARTTYGNEDWNIFLVSTHGGTEVGDNPNSTLEEINVPIILSGNDLDNKELVGTSLPPRENTDNILTINKPTTGERNYVRVPIAGTNLQGMEKFTIELWIKAGANSSDPSIIGDKDWDSGGNAGFTICRSGDKWKINIANQKRERYDIGSTKTIEDGRWHHIAVSFDKTSKCIIYQDGEKVAESKLTYKPTDEMTSPYNYLNFAQDGTGTYSGGAPNWAGSFNEVRIWNYVLSPETIKAYMFLRNIENSNHPNKSALGLYLKMDELRGNIIQDYSGKGNNGELIGTASERHPYYPIGLTDVSVNILSHFGLRVDGTWGLEGNVLKSNVPFRLFKVQ